MILPVYLHTPTDVFDPSPGCPSCGSQWGHPDTAHGAPGDTSLTGLLCSVEQVARLLVGDDTDLVGVVIGRDEARDLIGQAVARFRGEA